MSSRRIRTRERLPRTTRSGQYNEKSGERWGYTANRFADCKKKTKVAFNPLIARPKVKTTSVPSAASLALLDPSLDPATMAPTTLVLHLRRQRRELKRQERNETRRSTMRASTLRTEEEIAQREKDEKLHAGRKGRKALHEGGEVRGVRPMTQDELIAAALEEEERNKEALRDWLRKEEQRRELRRVGRKVVRGPRWTWISRTVGKMVEVLDEDREPILVEQVAPPTRAGPEINDAETSETPKIDPAEAAENNATTSRLSDVQHNDLRLPATEMEDSSTAAGPSRSSANAQDIPAASVSEAPPAAPGPDGAAATPPAPEDPSSAQYTRNYLILSQIPGGIAEELKIVLGDHVEWDQVMYIPGRNRPLSQSAVPSMTRS